MQLFTEVIPVHEAIVYLSQRFSSNRTSTRIEEFKSFESIIGADEWNRFKSIAYIENELDAKIEIDETIKYYFEPISIKGDIPCDDVISLGWLLLNPPSDIPDPLCYDSIAKFYEKKSQKSVIKHFSSKALSSFFNNDAGECTDMGQFITVLNEIIPDVESRWKIVDAVSNPVKHIDKLRPLVNKVSDYIEERSREFSDLMSKTINDFCAGQTQTSLLSKLGVNNYCDEKDQLSVYPSLMSFSYTYIVSPAKKRTRMILGVFVGTVVEHRKDKKSSAEYIKLLKTLADETRFNVLHELCDKYSYGQELSERFGSTRSAMYYHFEKLMGFGLIDLKSTEYRMLYTMNKRNVYDKLNALRDYLLNGWKPEEETEKGENDN